MSIGVGEVSVGVCEGWGLVVVLQRNEGFMGKWLWCSPSRYSLWHSASKSIYVMHSNVGVQTLWLDGLTAALGKLFEGFPS